MFSGYRNSFPEIKGRGAKLTSHLQLVLRLGMGGAVRLLSLYAFRLWTGTALPFIVIIIIIIIIIIAVKIPVIIGATRIVTKGLKKKKPHQVNTQQTHYKMQLSSEHHT
jgi:hypothetical protein